MRFIPTRVHAVIDYVVGVALIAAPWLFGFANLGGPAVWTPIIIGAVIILYSLATRYEYSLIGAIPMPAHLTLDVISGAFLATSPWILGYADQIWIPHVVVGVAEVLIALVTKTVPKRLPARPTEPARQTGGTVQTRTAHPENPPRDAEHARRPGETTRADAPADRAADGATRRAPSVDARQP
jgi:hypothetical protein